MSNFCPHAEYCPLCITGKKEPSQCKMKDVEIEKMSLLGMIKAQCAQRGISYLASLKQ